MSLTYDAGIELEKSELLLVFRVYDQTSGNMSAIKKFEYRQMTKQKHLFNNEAKALSRLTMYGTPRIVRLTRVVREADFGSISMEYVSGQTSCRILLCMISLTVLLL